MPMNCLDVLISTLLTIVFSILSVLVEYWLRFTYLSEGFAMHLCTISGTEVQDIEANHRNVYCTISHLWHFDVGAQSEPASQMIEFLEACNVRTS